MLIITLTLSVEAVTDAMHPQRLQWCQLITCDMLLVPMNVVAVGGRQRAERRMMMLIGDLLPWCNWWYNGRFSNGACIVYPSM